MKAPPAVTRLADRLPASIVLADRDRGQIQIGGLGWAFVFFCGLIIMGAIMENLVLEKAFDPLVGYAGNQTFQSSYSKQGLTVLKQWRNLFTFLVLGFAGMFFVGYAMLASRRRY